MKFTSFSLRLLAAVTVFATAACSSINDDRIPPANVNVVFTTIGDWELYGVAGAGQSREFILSERIPSGFPYKGVEGTGFGGVLLLADPLGQYLVYDLACPECIPNLSRIKPDTEATTAGIYQCSRCGSAYDTYAYGTPTYGPALSHKYGLQRYKITITGSSPYAIISR